MGWADAYIKALKEGAIAVQFRPRGGSMSPRINDKDLVTVLPIRSQLQINDIVLCKVNGKQYLHIIKAIRDSSYLIGNNHGKINGWTSDIYGIVVKVEK